MTKKIVGVVSLLFLLLVPLLLHGGTVSVVFAQEEQPTPEEASFFAMLKHRYRDYRLNAPQDADVIDIVDSYDSPQTFTLACTLYLYVTVQFTLTLGHWNPPTNPPASYANHDGYMRIKAWSQQPGPPKEISIEFEVKFNYAKMHPREQGTDFERTLNDVIFYHEMLHAWLAVHFNERMSEEECEKICDCTKDYYFSTEAQDHAIMEERGWEETYMVGILQNEYGYTVVTPTQILPSDFVGPLTPEQVWANPDGTWSIPLPNLNKPNPGIPEWGWTSSMGHWLRNVDTSSVTLKGNIEEGYTLTGKLSNPHELGHLEVAIDPPGLVMIVKTDFNTAPVGGIAVPVDKFGLLASYIALASTIIVATAATAIYVKRVKHRKKKQ